MDQANTDPSYGEINRLDFNFPGQVAALSVQVVSGVGFGGVFIGKILREDGLGYQIGLRQGQRLLAFDGVSLIGASDGDVKKILVEADKTQPHMFIVQSLSHEQFKDIVSKANALKGALSSEETRNYKFTRSISMNPDDPFRIRQVSVSFPVWMQLFNHQPDKGRSLTFDDVVLNSDVTGDIEAGCRVLSVGKYLTLYTSWNDLNDLLDGSEPQSDIDILIQEPDDQPKPPRVVLTPPSVSTDHDVASPSQGILTLPVQFHDAVKLGIKIIGGPQRPLGAMFAAQIVNGSVSHHAGVKVGDRLVAIDHISLLDKTQTQFTEIVRACTPHSQHFITVYRDPDFDLNKETKQRPDVSGSSYHRFLLPSKTSTASTEGVSWSSLVCDRANIGPLKNIAGNPRKILTLDDVTLNESLQLTPDTILPKDSVVLSVGDYFPIGTSMEHIFEMMGPDTSMITLTIQSTRGFLDIDDEVDVFTDVASATPAPATQIISFDEDDEDEDDEDEEDEDEDDELSKRPPPSSSNQDAAYIRTFPPAPADEDDEDDDEDEQDGDDGEESDDSGGSGIVENRDSESMRDSNEEQEELAVMDSQDDDDDDEDDNEDVGTETDEITKSIITATTRRPISRDGNDSGRSSPDIPVLSSSQSKRASLLSTLSNKSAQLKTKFRNSISKNIPDLQPGESVKASRDRVGFGRRSVIISDWKNISLTLVDDTDQVITYADQPDAISNRGTYVYSVNHYALRQAGLAPRDHIISVNGQDVTYRPACRVMEIIENQLRNSVYRSSDPVSITLVVSNEPDNFASLPRSRNDAKNPIRHILTYCTDYKNFGLVPVAHLNKRGKSFVIDVLPNTVADAAGFQIGDCILSLDNSSCDQMTYGKLMSLYETHGVVSNIVVQAGHSEYDIYRPRQVKIKRRNNQLGFVTAGSDEKPFHPQHSLGGYIHDITRPKLGSHLSRGDKILRVGQHDVSSQPNRVTSKLLSEARGKVLVGLQYDPVGFVKLSAELRNAEVDGKLYRSLLYPDASVQSPMESDDNSDVEVDEVAAPTEQIETIEPVKLSSHYEIARDKNFDYEVADPLSVREDRPSSAPYDVAEPASDYQFADRSTRRRLADPLDNILTRRTSMIPGQQVPDEVFQHDDVDDDDAVEVFDNVTQALQSEPDYLIVDGNPNPDNDDENDEDDVVEAVDDLLETTRRGSGFIYISGLNGDDLVNDDDDDEPATNLSAIGEEEEEVHEVSHSDTKSSDEVDENLIADDDDDYGKGPRYGHGDDDDWLDDFDDQPVEEAATDNTITEPLAVIAPANRSTISAPSTVPDSPSRWKQLKTVLVSASAFLQTQHPPKREEVQEIPGDFVGPFKPIETTEIEDVGSRPPSRDGRRPPTPFNFNNQECPSPLTSANRRLKQLSDRRKKAEMRKLSLGIDSPGMVIHQQPELDESLSPDDLDEVNQPIISSSDDAYKQPIDPDKPKKKVSFGESEVYEVPDTSSSDPISPGQELGSSSKVGEVTVPHRPSIQHTPRLSEPIIEPLKEMEVMDIEGELSSSDVVVAPTKYDADSSSLPSKSVPEVVSEPIFDKPPSRSLSNSTLLSSQNQPLLSDRNEPLSQPLLDASDDPYSMFQAVHSPLVPARPKRSDRFLSRSQSNPVMTPVSSFSQSRPLSSSSAHRPADNQHSLRSTPAQQSFRSTPPAQQSLQSTPPVRRSRSDLSYSQVPLRVTSSPYSQSPPSRNVSSSFGPLRSTPPAQHSLRSSSPVSHTSSPSVATAYPSKLRRFSSSSSSTPMLTSSKPAFKESSIYSTPTSSSAPRVRPAISRSDPRQPHYRGQMYNSNIKTRASLRKPQSFPRLVAKRVLDDPRASERLRGHMTELMNFWNGLDSSDLPQDFNQRAFEVPVRSLTSDDQGERVRIERGIPKRSRTLPSAPESQDDSQEVAKYHQYFKGLSPQQVDLMEHLFDLCDQRHIGQVTKKEFVDGLHKYLLD